MKPAAITRYEASGGKSQLRSYADGEGLTIELQERSLVVAWSAALPAGGFMERVAELVGEDAPIEAQLSPSTNGRRMIPFTEAQQLVAEAPERFTFIAVDTKDESSSFTWMASNPHASTRKYPETRGEVGMVLAAFNREWIKRFIEATATEHVREDVSGILSSAQRLTRQTPLAS